MYMIKLIVSVFFEKNILHYDYTSLIISYGVEISIIQEVKIVNNNNKKNF